MRLYPKYYPAAQSTKITTKSLRSLLPAFLKEVNENCHKRHDLIPLAWPEIIGEQLAPMTKAESFKEGTLYVKVFNSTLLSILTHREKSILLKKLKAKFPKTDIKEIRFQLG